MWEETGDLDALKQNAYELCKKFLEGPWQEISLEEFHLEKINGGLCNRLYRCSFSDDLRAGDTQNPSEVLLRIYGLLQQDIELLVQESVVFAMLSERGIGPKLYGVFKEGRLEQYIPSRPLESKDMRHFSNGIAKQLAKFHALKLPLKKHSSPLFDTIEKWLEDYRSNLLAQDRIPITHKELSDELKWMKEMTRKVMSPIVFCHNDVRDGNILVPKSDTTKSSGNENYVVFIDFEYSFYNYRAHDIANHFCSWCVNYNSQVYPFFDMNWEKYPSKNEQVEFIKAYLNQLLAEDGSHSFISMEAEIKGILRETSVYKLLSHFCTAMWGFRMSLRPSNDFGYLEYGRMRWEAFKRDKELLQHTA